MKKKGFTLVELLAVIAILAILVLISMPNIIEIFNKSKEESFKNEVETVKTELKKETFNSSLNGEKIPEVYSSFGENQLDMSGRELDYYAEMNSNGSIRYLEVTDFHQMKNILQVSSHHLNYY
jgi:prepilin-type N-terminal cleavage/methylation domain-containing protein